MCGGVLTVLGLGLGGCVLASPDFDEPTESEGVTLSGSAPGSSGESGSATASGSATSSGPGTTSATESSGGASGTTTETTGTTGTTGTSGTTGITGTTEASTTDGSTTDGSTSAGSEVCDLSPGAWSVGEAFPVGELNTEYTEADPVLLSDGVTLLFSSNRPGGLGIFDTYHAARAGFGAPFGPAVNSEAAYGWNHSSDEGKAELTNDRLEVVFGSSYSGQYELWRGLRGSVNEPFTLFSLLQQLVGHPEPDLDPHLSHDGLRVYFARKNGGQFDLAVAERGQPGVDFGVPTMLGGVNTGVSEANPTLSDDQRLMIFARAVGGDAGIDLFFAHRANADAVFDPPQPLAALNTKFDDAEPYLVELNGQCELFFVSDRGLGTDWDLYRAPIISN